MPQLVVRYAPKPWDRGEPLTRTVDVPSGYPDRAIAERWAWGVKAIKPGETVVSFQPDGASSEKKG